VLPLSAAVGLALQIKDFARHDDIPQRLRAVFDSSILQRASAMDNPPNGVISHASQVKTNG
jgi:predicted membrane chloride channel (bestrophin family)